MGGVGVATVAAPELRETKIMENPNFDNASIVDPKDAEIAELKKQLEVAHRRIAHQVEQVDQASDSIMGVIGHKVKALAESVASRETERALDDFDIHQYECEIGDMLDERLPEGLDDESRSEDLKAAVSELLANATIKIELE